MAIFRHGQRIAGAGSIDTELSSSSTNPVQNQAIAAEFEAVEAKLDTVETGAQKNTIESIAVNGADFQVDTATKKATGTVLTCSPIPEAVNIRGTTLQFCRDMADPAKGNCQVGMMYMGTSYLSDNPLDGDHRSEVLVKVIGGDPEEHKYVLQLELTSTNYHERRWISMFYGDKDTGAMQFGDLACPWFSSLMTPLSGYDPGTAHEGVLYKQYRAASERYVDDNAAPVSHLTDSSAHSTLFGAKQDTIADLPAIRANQQRVTTIPAATSEYTLTEGASAHTPSTASTYTLPAVTDNTMTHSILLDVDFSSTTSIAFTSTAPWELDKTPTIALGDYYRFICVWEAGGWRIYPLKLRKPVITATTPVAITGTAGTAITDTTLTASSSDHAAVTFSSNDLPEGIALANGVLSGTIAAAGTYTSTVTASAAHAADVSIAVTFTIA